MGGWIAIIIVVCWWLQEKLTPVTPAEDWANNWKKYFKPLPVGEKILICPSWEQTDNPEGRAVLSIDPGMAFGTGGHDTTRLVLETLEKYVTAGCDFLDVGCGSGILSIAACLLGAGRALGIDIDALAVKTAIENGALNGLTAPQYEIRLGDLARDFGYVGSCEIFRF